MKITQPTKVIVEVYNIADEADKELYQNILQQQLEEKLKIVRDEFTYDKLGTPKITIWYERYE